MISVGDTYLFTTLRTTLARMVKLAYTLRLGRSASAWGFKSLYGHMKYSIFIEACVVLARAGWSSEYIEKWFWNHNDQLNGCRPIDAIYNYDEQLKIVGAAEIAAQEFWQ